MKSQPADTYNPNQKSRILSHFVLWTLLLMVVISVGLVYQNHHSIRQINAIKRIGNYYDQAHVISDATRDVVILRSGINDVARAHDAEMLLQDIRRLVLVQDHLTKLNQSLERSVPFYTPMQHLHHEVETLLLKLNAISAYARPNSQNQTIVPDKLYSDYLLAFKNYQIDSEYVIDKLTQSYQLQLNEYKKKYTLITFLTLLAVLFVSLIFYRRMRRMMTDNQALILLNQKQEQAETQLHQQFETSQNELTKFKTIVNESPIAMLLLKPDDTVGFANQTLQRLLGYAERELLEQSLDYIMPEADADQFYDQLIQYQYRSDSETSDSFELRLRNKAGNLMPVSAMMADIYIDDIRFYEIIFYDIGRWKNAEHQLKETMAALTANQDRLDRKAGIAKHVFESVSQTKDTHITGLRYFSQAMNDFSGDLLLSSYLPGGSVRVLLCDFTGHGLAAALGTIPLSLTHNAMTAKGLSLTELIQELNEKLRVLLPTNIFCCMAAVDINRETQSAKLWNAGLPPILLIGSDDKIKRTIKSEHVPLGVASYNEQELRCEDIALEAGDYFYLHTDGVIETQNIAGESFGTERLHQCLQQRTDEEGSRITAVKAAITDFGKGTEPSDDITLVEVQALSVTDKIL